MKTKRSVLTDDLIYDDRGRAYQLLKSLGHGFYGAVKKGIGVDGQKVAIKSQVFTEQLQYLQAFIANRDDASLFLRRQIETEETLLRVFKRYVGHCHVDEGMPSEAHYTIMRYVKGKDFATVYPGLSLYHFYKTCKQLTRQLQKLHDAGYVHLDLHAPNVIVGKRTKLIDFGLATPIESGRVRAPMLGAHIPPEVLHAYHPGMTFYDFDPSVDVFAFGMMLYGLVCRKPFSYDATERLDDFVTRYRSYYQQAAAELVEVHEPDLKLLISKMIAADPAARPSLSELKQAFRTLKSAAASHK